MCVVVFWLDRNVFGGYSCFWDWNVFLVCWEFVLVVVWCLLGGFERVDCGLVVSELLWWVLSCYCVFWYVVLDGVVGIVWLWLVCCVFWVGILCSVWLNRGRVCLEVWVFFWVFWLFCLCVWLFSRCVLVWIVILVYCVCLIWWYVVLIFWWVLDFVVCWGFGWWWIWWDFGDLFS